MLNEKEPFKTMFWFLKLYGYWQPNLMSKKRKTLAITAFIIFEPLLVLLSLLSFTKVNNIGDFAYSFAVAFIFTSSINYSAMIFLNNEKIQKFFEDFTQALNENPKIWNLIDEICQVLFKSSKRKAIGLTIWFLSLNIEALIEGSIGSMVYQPEAVKNHKELFVLMMLYFVLNFVYTAFISFMLQDFCNHILTILLTFVEFFREELKNLDLKGENGKHNLIKYIKMHQNLKNLMDQYRNIFEYPLSFRATFSAYLLCTMAFATTAVHKQLNFIAILTLVTTLQLFRPCNIAQQIETASENFIFSITEINWTDADLKTKKLLLTFMTNLAKPVLKLKLYGFIEINLKTFTRSINVAYSAYTVLNSIHE